LEELVGYGEKLGKRNEMAKHLVVDHPSPRTIQENIQALKKEIGKIETPHYNPCKELIGYRGTLREDDEMAHMQTKQQLSNCQALLRDIQEFDPGFGRVGRHPGLGSLRLLSIDNSKYSWS
jgi:hypothetical protein